jgi:hypothetical protein
MKPTDKELSVAYKAGISASKDDEKRSTNPHKSKALFKAWDDGWFAYDQHEDWEEFKESNIEKTLSILTEDRTPTKDRPNHYRGWNYWFDEFSPKSGQWKAMRAGVGMNTNNEADLKHMIDAKVHKTKG